jgi:hypothetical protein
MFRRTSVAHGQSVKAKNNKGPGNAGAFKAPA